jgi:hypothetical protein
MSNAITFYDPDGDPVAHATTEVLHVIERWGRRLPACLDAKDGHRSVEMTAGALADRMMEQAPIDRAKLEAAPHSLRGYARVFYVLDPAVSIYTPMTYVGEE